MLKFETVKTIAGTAAGVGASIIAASYIQPIVSACKNPIYKGLAAVGGIALGVGIGAFAEDSMSEWLDTMVKSFRIDTSNWN